MSRLFVDDFRDAVHASDLAPLERLLLLTMARFCTYSTGEHCRPGAPTLAAQTGMSERHVKRLRKLLEGTWLEVMDQGAVKGGRRATEYRLLVPTGDSRSPVILSTGDTQSTTGDNGDIDRGHGVTRSPLISVDHRADEIAAEHKAAAADGLRAYREAVGREAS